MKGKKFMILAKFSLICQFVVLVLHTVLITYYIVLGTLAAQDLQDKLFLVYQ